MMNFSVRDLRLIYCNLFIVPLTSRYIPLLGELDNVIRNDEREGGRVE